MKKYSLYYEDVNQKKKIADFSSLKKANDILYFIESFSPINNDFAFFTKENDSTKNPLNDISHASSLDDIELPQMLVHLRHEYLEAAKDLSKEGRDKQDIEFGDMACDHALSIQNILDSIGL